MIEKKTSGQLDSLHRVLFTRDLSRLHFRFYRHSYILKELTAVLEKGEFDHAIKSTFRDISPLEIENTRHPTLEELHIAPDDLYKVERQALSLIADDGIGVIRSLAEVMNDLYYAYAGQLSHEELILTQEKGSSPSATQLGLDILKSFLGGYQIAHDLWLLDAVTILSGFVFAGEALLDVRKIDLRELSNHGRAVQRRLRQTRLSEHLE